AEIGYLRQDWLANTRDATPLFSALVCATLRWLQFEGLFYLYYALLLGVYFTILYKIAKQEADLQPRARKLAFLALFFLIHSAGWRFVLSRTLGEEWTYAFEGGLANQRLLGSVFQPSVFGVFLLVAVWLATQQKSGLAIVSLALAAWFHSTYIFPATLLFCGILATTLIGQPSKPENNSTRQIPLQLIRTSIFFLILIAPSALYALTFNFSPEVAPDLAERGRRILFEFRIPHHADPTVWFNFASLFQIGLMLSALILTRQKAIRWLLGVPFMLSAALTLIVFFTRSPSLALLFPWRVSTVLVPLSSTILIARLVATLPSEKSRPNSAVLIWVIPSTATSLIVVALLVGWVRITFDLQRQRNQPERPLIEFVAQHKQPQDLYLIPLKMQDFRLASGAPIFVDFKSTPYHPVEVLEWYRRYQIANDFYQFPSCDRIGLLTIEGITHIVLPVSTPLSCPNLETIYEDDFYQLLGVHSLHE
ncbi:MAG: DUF6798 domain-containing protein, partial [Anaerolineales bacterium]